METYFDKFDIVEAHLVFYSHYHEGVRSRKYKRMSKISSYFKARPNLNYSTLKDNGKNIYIKLQTNEEL